MRSGHIFDGCHVVNEVITLEDECYIMSAVPGKPFFHDVFFPEQYPAVRGAVQAAEQGKQRGFSASGGSQDSIEFSSFKFCRYIF